MPSLDYEGRPGSTDADPGPESLRDGRLLSVVLGLAGAVAFVQRFGSALQLTPHLHVLVPEAVFELLTTRSCACTRCLGPRLPRWKRSPSPWPGAPSGPRSSRPPGPTSSATSGSSPPTPRVRPRIVPAPPPPAPRTEAASYPRAPEAVRPRRPRHPIPWPAAGWRSTPGRAGARRARRARRRSPSRLAGAPRSPERSGAGHPAPRAGESGARKWVTRGLHAGASVGVRRVRPRQQQPQKPESLRRLGRPWTPWKSSTALRDQGVAGSNPVSPTR
jgi:hypothetical protein